MVFSLVIILLIVVFLAFFVGKNLSNVCTIWLFSDFSGIPVSVLVFIAFGCGIVFSILCIVIGRLKKSGKKAAAAPGAVAVRKETRRGRHEKKSRMVQSGTPSPENSGEDAASSGKITEGENE